MASDLRWRDKKVLITLALVVVVMLLAVVGVVILVNLSRNSTDDVEGDGNMGTNETICPLGDFDEIATCMEEYYRQNGDVDAFSDGYGAMISEAIAIGNYRLASELIVQRSSSLIMYGYCDMGIKVLDQEDLTEFGAENMAYVYSRAASLASECDNNEMREKWVGLMMKAQEGATYESF